MAEQMLDGKIREQVKQIFAGLDQPVAVLFFGSKEDNCEYCEPTRQLMEEIVSLSDKLQLHEYDVDAQPEMAERYCVENLPGIVIASPGGGVFKDYGIQFSGIPAGHEFTSIIRDLLMVSSRESGLNQETRDFLAGIDKPVHLQVFVTPT